MSPLFVPLTPFVAICSYCPSIMRGYLVEPAVSRELAKPSNSIWLKGLVHQFLGSLLQADLCPARTSGDVCAVSHFALVVS